MLDAATAVLIEDGYARFSIRRVAARARARPGHVQYYFPSKQALVQALLARALAALEARRGTARVAGGDPLAAALDDVLAEHGRPETVPLFIELRALAARDPSIAEAARAYYARYWRGVVDALLAANPGLGRARAERRAALVVALLEGLMLFRAPGDPRRLPLLGLERELVLAVRRLAAEP